MGKKEDDAADFLEKLLSGGANFVDVDDDSQDLLDKFNSTVNANDIKLSAQAEREYQEYIKNTAKHDDQPVSRAEFLAILNATTKSSKEK